MTNIDITYEQAREQVARAIRRKRADVMTWGGFGDSDTGLALAALDVLWPVMEGLRAELAHARSLLSGPHPLAFRFQLGDDRR